MVEQLTRNEQVAGSSPVEGSLLQLLTHSLCITQDEMRSRCVQGTVHIGVLYEPKLDFQRTYLVYKKVKLIIIHNPPFQSRKLRLAE